MAEARKDYPASIDAEVEELSEARRSWSPVTDFNHSAGVSRDRILKPP